TKRKEAVGKGAGPPPGARRPGKPPRSGGAAPPPPARHAVAHARLRAHGRPRHRRAHRRDPRRARLLRDGHRAAPSGQGRLGRMADRLSTAEVAALLESAVATIRAEITALPPAVTTFHPAAPQSPTTDVIA